MRTKKLLSVYYFSILMLTKYAFMKMLYGIDTSQMEVYYVDILFNDNLSSSDRSELAHRIGAASVQLNIEQSLGEMEKACAKMSHNLQKPSFFILKLMRAQFDGMKNDFSNSNEHKFTRTKLCLLWQMAQNLDNAKTTLKLAKVPGIMDDKFHEFNCNDLDKLMPQQSAEQKGKIKVPKWVKEFADYFSDIHLYGLNSLMKLEGKEKLYEMADWFGQKQLKGETKLSHAFRTTHLRGEIERIKEIKRRMVHHLVCHFNMERLEMMHSIRMAAGFVEEQTMKVYYELLFCHNNGATETFLEYAILCNRIFAYFLQQNGANGTIEGIQSAVLWQSFVDSTAQIVLVKKSDGTAQIVQREDTLASLQALWYLLKEGKKNYIQTVPKCGEMPRQLLDNLAKCFINLYAENEQFKKSFWEQSDRRRKFKEMIANAEHELGGGVVPDQFWHIFAEESELSSSSSSFSYDFSVLIKIKDICPEKKISQKELMENLKHKKGEELFSYTMMKQYIDLLVLMKETTAADEHFANQQLLKSIDYKSILLYYRERMKELFKKAMQNHRQQQNQNEKNGKHFLEKIGNYLVKWAEMVNEWYQNGGTTNNWWAQTVCKSYKFIHQIVTDKSLAEMDKKWQKMIENNVMELGDQTASNLNENMMVSFGKIVLLSEHKVPWHRIDCATENSAKTLVDEIRKVPQLIEMFHLFAIITLLSQFDEMRSICCFASAEELAKTKHRIEALTSDKVLDRLEMLYPEVLHYDLLTNERLMHMLLKQFEHRSGTAQAQIVEARNSTPLLINEILLLQNQLVKNSVKMLKKSPEIREILLQKIVNVKRTFFSQLAMATHEQSVIRAAICPPLFLYLKLKSITIGRTKIKGTNEMIKWHPNSKCNNEENVKRAFEENRVLFKLKLTQFFLHNPEDFQLFLQKLSENPGAKTKFLKLLIYDASTKVLPEAESNVLVESLWPMDDKKAIEEFFYDELRFTQLYFAFLTMFNSMKWLRLKLRLDLFVFIHWTDATVAAAFLVSSNSLAVRRVSKFWGRTKVLFLQLHDRCFDEAMDEMPSLQRFYLHFLSELNLLLGKNFGGKNGAKSEKTMDEELKKIIQKSQKAYETNKMIGAKLILEEEQQRYEKLEHKMMELRIETLDMLMQKNEGIRDALKYFLQSLLDEEELPEFWGKDTILYIWRAIAPNHFGELGKKLEEKLGEKAAEDKSETKSKKKKSKRKKNKNGNDKAVEEGEKDTETVENTVITVEENTVSEGGVTNEKEEKAEAEGEGKEEGDAVLLAKEEQQQPQLEQQHTTAKNDGREEAKDNDDYDDDTVWDKEETVKTDEIKNGGTDGAKAINSSEKVSSSPTSLASASSSNGETNLKEFADDEILAQKYDEFVHTFMTVQQHNVADRLIEMLNVGAFVNEISHRLEAIEWMGGEQWKNVQKKRSFLWWKDILEKEYSAQLLEPFYDLLREIWGEMEEIGKNLDKFEKEKSENDRRKRIETISRQIQSRKFGQAIIERKIKNWDKMPNDKMEKAFFRLFGSAEDENAKNGKILSDFQRNLKFIEEEFIQRKLDVKIFEKYKSDKMLSPFVTMKDKLNFNEKNAKIFPTEKWQQLNFSEEIEKRKLKEIEKLKKALKFEDNIREKAEKLMLKFNGIFEKWSAEAQFQFPFSHFLNNSIDKLEPICLLPDEFGQERIFGQTTECDQKNREKCSDQSLFCTLCKTLNVTFIQKFQNDNKNYDDNNNNLLIVPMLQIEVENVKIEVKFVEIPGIRHIPRIKFTAKQMKVFLIQFGRNIEKLENNDHFDEGVYWYEIGKRNMLRTQYENDADRLEQFDKITELFHRSRAKALRQRKLLQWRKEMVFVLAEHSIHLKLLQFLLPENEYLSLFRTNQNKLLEGEADHFSVAILDKFRTIFAYLKRWAQNNFIFCNELGYLNGQMLLLMLAKVFLLFPNSSVSFLIDKFFLTYSKWKWPMPVQMTEISKKKISGKFLSWAPFREWMWRRKLAWEHFPKKIRKEKLKFFHMEMAMAVITPTFPEQNVAENLNISSAKVVQNELRRASDKIRRNVTEQNGAIFEPIREIKFTEKYDHFIVILCNGPHVHVETFCAFVGGRLRFELFEFVEKPLAIWVNFCHVFPSAITPTNDECSAVGKAKNIANKISLCTRVWLVGIEMAPNQKANKAFKTKLKGNLQKKLEHKIKSEFENGLFHNVWLNSEIVERKDLQKWGIDQNV